MSLVSCLFSSFLFFLFRYFDETTLIRTDYDLDLGEAGVGFRPVKECFVDPARPFACDMVGITEDEVR